MDEALNLGAGMHDYHKSEDMFKVEQQLPFLNAENIKKQDIFEFIGIDNLINGYRVKIALKPAMILRGNNPTVRPMTIENPYRKKKALKISYKGRDISKMKKQDTYVEKDFKMDTGCIWAMTNEGKAPIYVNFFIPK